MKLIWRLFLLLALVALGLWLWSVLFPSPEKVIRKKLANLARAVSFTSNEGPLALANHASNLEACFSVDAQVNLDAPDHRAYVFNDRAEIIQAAMAARAEFRTLTVEFFDEEVALAADKLSATVDLTVKAKVPRDRDFYVQEMKFILKKINGDWLIVRVETVKTLSRARMGEVGSVARCAPLSLTSAASGARGMTRPTFPVLEKRDVIGADAQCFT